MKLRLFSRLLPLVLLTMAACSPSATAPTATPPPVYTRVTEATLTTGEEIPVPDGDSILTVSGKIGNANVDDTIQMNLQTIESVGQVDYTVMDPFEEQAVTYRGPLLSDLLAVWGVPDDATELYMTAINDYSVSIPLAAVRPYPVVFALQANGEYMPVSTRGPAMVVFPYDDFEFEPAIYNDYWIWQIKSIEVR